MRAGAAKKPEQSKITLETDKMIQNNSLGSLGSQAKFNQDKIRIEVTKIKQIWLVSWVGQKIAVAISNFAHVTPIMNSTQIG